jgi:hypothetical protein
MDIDEVETDSYVTLRLIAFLLRAVGVLLFVILVITLIYGRDLTGASTFAVRALEIGAFVVGLVVMAFGECISLMVHVARNIEITAEASIKMTLQLSRMIGDPKPGDRIEPRLF